METHDKLDALLYGIADEADASVDYAAMLAAISQSAKAQEFDNTLKLHCCSGGGDAFNRRHVAQNEYEEQRR